MSKYSIYIVYGWVKIYNWVRYLKLKHDLSSQLYEVVNCLGIDIISLATNV